MKRGLTLPLLDNYIDAKDVEIKKLVLGTGKTNLVMGKIAESYGFVRQSENKDSGFVHYVLTR